MKDKKPKKPKSKPLIVTYKKETLKPQANPRTNYPKDLGEQNRGGKCDGK